jgi:hypothetical protein
MLLEIIIFIRGNPKLGPFEGVGNENLLNGPLQGAQKVSAPFKSQDFHCPPLQMGRVMGFPA